MSKSGEKSSAKETKLNTGKREEKEPTEFRREKAGGFIKILRKTSGLFPTREKLLLEPRLRVDSRRRKFAESITIYKRRCSIRRGGALEAWRNTSLIRFFLKQRALAGYGWNNSNGRGAPTIVVKISNIEADY